MTPFLKWAGGKRWLFHNAFVSKLPAYDRYVEPFLGGGAGFFTLRPERALLADVNPELINLYRTVRDRPKQIQRGLIELQEKHSPEFYYEMRRSVPETPLARALRTLYLNRTCWNGLYRLNLAGLFNVPIGTKNTVVLDTDDFEYASRILKRARIEVADFESVINRSKEGDLVFVDPPYTVKHNMNGFIKYNEAIFTWADQIRLRNCCKRAARRGASVIITNADHESIRELYSQARDFQVAPRTSVISGSPNFRSGTTELVITL